MMSDMIFCAVENLTGQISAKSNQVLNSIQNYPYFNLNFTLNL